jgi:hypothetical protein
LLRAHTSGTASNDAGPEEPAAINLAAFRDRCQRKKPGFHRNFAVFFGFSLENPEFLGFSALSSAGKPLFMRGWDNHGSLRCSVCSLLALVKPRAGE